MTFLEPLMLYALPLALLPVIIHLLNRLRHRTIKWAAMMFLLSANRRSTKHAKIRQWLILAMRVLAVVSLVFMISRPLASGWLGGIFKSAPDTILIIFDRSLSMEGKLNGGITTKREETLRIVSEGAQSYQGRSHIVLIDTASRKPQRIEDVGMLSRLSVVLPTDTEADILSAIQSAIDWIRQNKPGSAELWIASDFQKSNWKPQSERWQSIISQMEALSRSIRVRLISVGQGKSSENNSITVREATVGIKSDKPALELEIGIERTSAEPATIPVGFVLNGSRYNIDVSVQGQSTLYRHRVSLDRGEFSGWGKVELPADSNLRDNIGYFVFAPPPSIKVAVVSSNTISARYLALAISPIKGDTNKIVELIQPEKITSVNWLDYGLVVWNARLPDEKEIAGLKKYVESGGVLVVFPAGLTGVMDGINLGEAETAQDDKTWKIQKWSETDGILARTEEGLSLPLNELIIRQRQAVYGAGLPVATFEDGGAFIRKKIIGKGQIYVWASTPDPQWSNLQEGVVLVPAMQRLFELGSRRITQAGMLICGDLTDDVPGTAINVVEGGSDYRYNAGIYRIGSRLVALNHPPAEDDPEILENAEARALFKDIPVQLFEEKGNRTSKFQSELWRTFLIAMLIFLLVEAFLILPSKVEGGDLAFEGISGKTG